MTVWLTKQDIADRLGVHVKTAEALMMQMHPVAISGNVRKRWRVSEANLEQWMMRQGDGKAVPVSRVCGSTRKLARR